MKNTINIQNESNIHAEGKLSSKKCKPVICIETGEVFSSVTDAAEKFSGSAQNLSTHLTGKRRSFSGKHFCYLYRTMESLDTIMERLQKTAAMEDDARKWREYQAEQERVRQAEEKRLEEERKAKEKYEADVQKAKDKIARRTEICERLANELARAEQRKMEAEMELEALLDNNQQEVA